MKQLFDSVFSWKLYREALSQLRLMGFLTSGALLIFMAVLPILDATAWSWHGRNFARDASMIDFSVLLYLYVWIAPFILTFALFGFLNSRKKSDFYHSLPVTRQALFLSFVKAVLTWLLVTVVLAVLIPATIYALLGAPRVFSEVGPLLLLLIPALSFAVAVAALVASVSGTRFTNLSLAVVIVAIPPLLSEFLRNAVADSVPTLAPSGVGLFGLQLSNTYYTFDMWSILDTIGREGGRWLQEMLLNAGFTAVVALVLLLCAGIFFVRRRSEMAGNSAPNQWMQWMYRISIAFLPLLVFFMQDFMFFHIADFISGLMVTLIISIILVCAFDLISTKAWKNLLYAIPAVGIASLIMILLVTLIWGVALSESTFSPKPEQIQSVRVVNARNPAWGWDFITHGNT
ncbi:MAG: hypothetical protein FWD93_04085, partial [Coriobacteriia bacterium]|nr:hypothetical protein [Coriobacteriia bacterium]